MKIADESYAQGMLVLEQCLGTQPNDDQASHDSKATVLLAMSDLLYERFHLYLSLISEFLLVSGGKLRTLY